jgi:hypothetical protein
MCREGSHTWYVEVDCRLIGPRAARSGDLAGNWSGAIWISHGIDGGCAFQTGFEITCNAGRITNFVNRDAAGCPRAR